MKILAIETSCDETSVAILADGKKLLSNLIFSQTKMHRPFGGIVPEIASRAHVEKINSLVEKALKIARCAPKKNESLSKYIDAIAVTVGPGLVGSLLVGKMTAEALGWSGKIPVIGINHLEAHLLSSLYQQPKLKPPFLGLIVSGGHTDLVAVESVGNYTVLGRTRDDAAGECFDKVANLLNLPYPGGPEIERMAKKGNPKTILFPRALMPGTFDFSFSGLKTSALYTLQKNKSQGKKVSLKDFCASFQAAIVDTLVNKTIAAALKLNYKTIALGGGVSCNSALQKKFKEKAKANKLKIFFPEKNLTTDNAAMIALVAHHQLKSNPSIIRDTLKIDPSLQIKTWI